MATYAIGDVHGCFDELQLLLQQINFNPITDRLWFTGDLVNGGAKSLETLLFIKSLQDRVICVLGNHDLTLLSLATGAIGTTAKHAGFSQVLTAPQLPELITWLTNLPLIHFDPQFKILLVHAGLAPQWTITDAIDLAAEVTTTLQNPAARQEFLQQIFGDPPNCWDHNLQNWQRLRCITNYLTRSRFCASDGTMDLINKGSIADAPAGMQPWFQIPNRQSRDTTIIFGHWAALMGQTLPTANVIALDTGCMWGNYLSALRLEDRRFFKVKKL